MVDKYRKRHEPLDLPLGNSGMARAHVGRQSWNVEVTHLYVLPKPLLRVCGPDVIARLRESANFFLDLVFQKPKKTDAIGIKIAQLLPLQAPFDLPVRFLFPRGRKLVNQEPKASLSYVGG